MHSCLMNERARTPTVVKTSCNLLTRAISVGSFTLILQKWSDRARYCVDSAQALTNNPPVVPPSGRERLDADIRLYEKGWTREGFGLRV